MTWDRRGTKILNVMGWAPWCHHWIIEVSRDSPFSFIKSRVPWNLGVSQALQNHWFCCIKLLKTRPRLPRPSVSESLGRTSKLKKLLVLLHKTHPRPPRPSVSEGLGRTLKLKKQFVLLHKMHPRPPRPPRPWVSEVSDTTEGHMRPH